MKIPNRFIVVDDDTTNNLVCKYVIHRFNNNADVQLFTDPEKALEIIKDSSASAEVETVLFLDLNMPTMSGPEFLEEFENFNQDVQKQISIYILTASLDLGDRDRAERNVFVKGYLPKPLSMETMNQIFG
ncbi:two-component system response regulator [Dyadobacter sp. NIV53]|uniref:response regulator n=1 Tax=Dyadobacter sp. NIV53 TaxID=2861765 RepID=UPI001C879DEE|nr:response regulator [Dyadobacter sp. NIV53]